MIKSIIFDTDGVVVHRAMNFSERYAKEFAVPLEKLTPFYHNEFQLCLVGKADLKSEIVKYLPQWNWNGSVEELLEFWFIHEKEIDYEILDVVKSLRQNGINCYLNTNNEKYRSDFLWNDLSLKNHFSAIFASGNLGYKKPQKEFWSTIHKRIGSPAKEEVLVVDNEQDNVDSALAFGFTAEYFTDKDLFTKNIQHLLKEV